MKPPGSAGVPSATRQVDRDGQSIQHRCTGLTGREFPAREASSGDDPMRICEFPELQASRFLKKILCILCINVDQKSSHA